MKRIRWIDVAAVGAIVVAVILMTVKNLHIDGAVPPFNVSADPARDPCQPLNARFMTGCGRVAAAYLRTATK